MAIVESVFEVLLRVKLPAPINAMPLPLAPIVLLRVKFPAPPNVIDEPSVTTPDSVAAVVVLELINAPVPSPP